ncbi:MAG: BPSS1780 family membrane protein [Rhodocyclaceae bacterium]|nr:BPSS1780 family membrane protein [Rhodocyclaceae bacterium]
MPARRGAFWLVAGYQLFRRNPPLLTALTLTYLLVVQVSVQLLPEVGPFLLPLALPAMVLIVANGARIADQGNRLLPGALLHGIKGNGVNMLRLGGLHLIGAFIFIGIVLLLESGGVTFADFEKGDDPELIWALLRLLLLAIPFLMAFLFPPYLTGWDGVPAGKSLFFSFVACVRNWRALAAYLLAVIAVAVALPGLALILAATVSESASQVVQVVVRMLMVFLLAPVLTASVYVGYRDIFHPPMDEHA